MKIYIILDVELVDLDSFEYFTGGEEFSVEFNEFAISRLRFRFEDMQKLELAKNRLAELNLKYNELFSIELESDDELKKYPIVMLAFNTQSGILYKDEDTLYANQSLATSHFNEDLESGELVVTEDAKSFLGSRFSILKFVRLKTQDRKLFLVENLEEMLNPRIVDHEKYSLREVSGGYFSIINSDGKIQFSKDSYDEIKIGKFKEMKTFLYDKKLLQSAAITYVASGEFAYDLKENFDLVKNNISIVIPTLDHI